jgi:plastocyanin
MKLYLSHAAVSGLCGVLGMLTFAVVTHAPVGAMAVAEQAATVTMTDSRFQPGTVRVSAGGTVTWRNTSQVVHTVTGSGMDSGTIQPGATFSHTFDRPGTYDYYCTPHRGAGMVGRVVVTG